MPNFESNSKMRSTTNCNHHNMYRRPTKMLSSPHYHCYLLRSLDPFHLRRTYIGYSINPERRIRQHNGLLRCGSAYQTRNSGRPWKYVCIIDGFSSSKSALQFEWAWQHPHLSKSLLECLNSTTLLNIISDVNDINRKLKLMQLLLCQCKPFSNWTLSIYFLEHFYKENFMSLFLDNKIKNEIFFEKRLGQYNSKDTSLIWSEKIPYNKKCGVSSVESLPFFQKLIFLRYDKDSIKTFFQDYFLIYFIIYLLV